LSDRLATISRMPPGLRAMEQPVSRRFRMFFLEASRQPKRRRYSRRPGTKKRTEAARCRRRRDLASYKGKEVRV